MAKIFTPEFNQFETINATQLEIAGAPHCTRRVSVGRNAL
ncbi:hypothetical protein ACVW0Q_000737 [Thermostichus sp. MS-CIW-21]|jgi:hypothetical protein|nr:hypothetical protein SYN65AY6A5_07575 [Synechococcus sp. 65AY6A5]PIK93079.1 hypothetical protein SYN65AY6LI_00910 [Synechococcus sp. 65AY6Li]PIK96401.1 hypothetical protein SYN60AY4M2_04305 [Synechococcus sp. 60AY4M2]PIL02421.1 hypothetical protein SYN65AY640_04425 [Synechococcus sp. 65AY640]